MTGQWSWEVASDPAEVHALLLASDAHHARAHQLTAPRRREESTRSRVAERQTHLLRHGVEPAGMFTLSTTPPFDDVTIFPPTRRPLYLQRLAVAPGWLRPASLVGLRCVRRAFEVARDAGASALRAEANPDLAATLTLLRSNGFEQVCPASEGELRRIYLNRRLEDQEAH
jgi:hypothetical protein